MVRSHLSSRATLKVEQDPARLESSRGYHMMRGGKHFSCLPELPYFRDKKNETEKTKEIIFWAATKPLQSQIKNRARNSSWVSWSCHANFLSDSQRNERTSEPRCFDVSIILVGTGRLDVSSLLALVADLLAAGGRFLRAVTRVVARLAAVVAFHAVDTLSYQGH